MAKVLPAMLGPTLGLEGGQLLYQSGQKLFARIRPTPVDPRAAAQLRIRNALAAGSRTFTNELTAAEQQIWTDNTRYGTAGNLELISTAIASEQAAAPRPKTRTTAPTQQPPTVVEFEYIPDPFKLEIGVDAGPVGPGSRLSAYANAPPTTGERPSRSSERLIESYPNQPGKKNLVPEYLAAFGGRNPASEQVTLRMRSYDPNIPTFSNSMIIAGTRTDLFPRASIEIAEDPIPRFFSTTVNILAVFKTIPIGDPVELSVNAGSLEWVGPVTVGNGVLDSGILIDNLDRNRQASVSWTFDDSTGSTISILATPEIGQ